MEELYSKLKTKHNEYYIKFVLLTYFNYDIEFQLEKEYEEKEKRKYQAELRKAVLKRYENRCVISGIKEEIILEVAHIIPVSECIVSSDKANIDNTLLLRTDIHNFFDQYLISINPITSIVETSCDYLILYNNKPITLNDGTRKYLKQHYNKYLYQYNKK